MKPIPELSAVTPLADFMCFEVQSFTDPDKTYRVDKTLWYGSGACSCEQFCCKIQPQLGKGDWEAPTTCKHINLVDRWIALRVTRMVIVERLGGKRYDPSEPNL
jgi:hypothetical protein